MSRTYKLWDCEKVNNSTAESAAPQSVTRSQQIAGDLIFVFAPDFIREQVFYSRWTKID